jgi:3'(2'), 5'-bisphosphate nucleotidase
MKNYSILTAQLKVIAKKAGEAILEVYYSTKDIEISQKSDDSPLTLADRKSNTLICEGLENLPMHFPIVSEENKELPFDERKDFNLYWLVDPLDGTKEFIKRNGDFTINIALIHDGSPVLGVVYAPCTGEMYWAVKGEGAFRQIGEEAHKLQASNFNISSTGLKVVASRSHMNDATLNFINKLNSPELVSKGSSLKFLMLANGEAQLYPRMSPTMEWDTAAAQIILEEAGGKILEADSLRPLHYNKLSLVNPNFIAMASGDI